MDLLMLSRVVRAWGAPSLSLCISLVYVLRTVQHSLVPRLDRTELT